MHSVTEVFQRYGEAYRKKFAADMPADQLKAMWCIENCQSGKLGIAVYACQDCGQSHSVPRSCGNRHCPTCQAGKGKLWLEKQLSKLLPCPYFFLCFTVPQKARMIVRSHPKECYEALMDAAAQTTMTLASNPRHVGSRRLSMTAVLHTWGRDLSYNPHVHIVAAGGALSQDGSRWLPSRVDFLVPVWAASDVYRAKVREAMKELGLLDKFPPEVWTQPWVVHCRPVGDGQDAMKYLAPYIFRVAISNRRLRSVEDDSDGQGQVTYDYRPVGSRKYLSISVSAEEFIRRFLQHVLPKGFRKVRHYGLAAARSPMHCELLKWLVTVTLQMVYTLTVAAPRTMDKPLPKCPACGGCLRLQAFIPAQFCGYDTS